MKRHYDAKKSGVSECESAFIISQLLLALQHCHQHGVIHRDVKPENVVVSESGKVTLVDFGLAAFSGSRDLMMAGTTFYMAPEMVLGKYDARVDLWSLGVLSYLLLTTFLPFGGETRGDVFERICQSRLRFPED